MRNNIGEALALSDIEAAASRIAGKVRRTPTLPFSPLRERLPFDAYLKLENLQVTGSFKPRGALNKMLSLAPEVVAAGIVTASGGNHGVAVAYGAAILGAKATVYVPERANQARRDRITRWGAELVVHGRDWDDAYEAALDESKRTGEYLVHPFDDIHVMAGQATAGMEVLADCPVNLDAVVVPVGGGGLLGGVAAFVKQLSPKTIIVGVEPIGAASMTASIRTGSLVELPQVTSIADTLSPRKVGELTLQAAQRFVDRIVLVDDEALVRTMRKLWNEFNFLVEPAGAAGLAALLEEKTELPHGSKVAVFISGGNLDASLSLAQYDKN